MSYYDNYIPEPSLKCPVCGTILDHWQGCDGCGLFVTWKQGHKFPIAHPWPDECLEDPIVGLEYTLPDEFQISAHCDKCNRWVEAYGFCSEEIWVRSEFITHLNWRPGKGDSVRDEHKIKHDLERWLNSKNNV